MKILLLTQWFEPEPAFKGLSFAKSLAERGHDVQVLTGFPNYPEGKLYPGYRIRPFLKEFMEGISVVRVPLYPSHDSSTLRRVANYVSFAISAALTRPMLLDKPDVIYVYHPPPTIGLAAMALKMRFGVPIVYDIQDMWPDSLTATGMLSNQSILQVIDRWCRLVYKIADRIVVLSPGFKKLLISRGVPGKKIHVIFNWCEEHLLKPLPIDDQLLHELDFAERFNILFAGNIGQAQALGPVLEAAQVLQTKAPRIQLIFMGGGVAVASLKQTATAMGLDNVRFFPRRPMSQIADVLNLADVLLVHLRRDALFEITVPSKTQAYMSVGKPILMGVRGDAAELVRRAGAGLVCEPEDVEDIVEKVLRFYEMPENQRLKMGVKGRNFYLSNMSINAGVAAFENLFSQLVHGGTLNHLSQQDERMNL